jgi:hypothetical protein
MDAHPKVMIDDTWVHLGTMGLASAWKDHISRWMPQSDKASSCKRKESSSVLQLSSSGFGHLKTCIG